VGSQAGLPMITATKTKLVEIIKKDGKASPNKLVAELKISPQAIHRHLKALVHSGVIESRGGPPKTYYVLADKPDFKQAIEWAFSKKIPVSNADVSETRDVFSARLNRFVSYSELLTDDLPLVISTAGEVGNNSFDHNLGQWKDVPGCWFEIQKTKNRLWVLIADRGQGVFRSISRVIPKVKNDNEALEIAFNKRVSGRSTEQRGNGLKYVLNVINKSTGRGVACCSGHGRVEYGDLGKECLSVLTKKSQISAGTITLICWGLKNEN